MHELDEILKSDVKEMESYLVNHTLQGSMQEELAKFMYFMSAVAANVENPPVNDKLTETDDHEFADKIRCIIAGFETTKEQFADENIIDLDLDGLSSVICGFLTSVSDMPVN